MRSSCTAQSPHPRLPTFKADLSQDLFADNFPEDSLSPRLGHQGLADLISHLSAAPLAPFSSPPLASTCQHSTNAGLPRQESDPAGSGMHLTSTCPIGFLSIILLPPFSPFSEPSRVGMASLSGPIAASETVTAEPLSLLLFKCFSKTYGDIVRVPLAACVPWVGNHWARANSADYFPPPSVFCSTPLCLSKSRKGEKEG